MKKANPTTSKVGKRDPDHYPLGKFSKRLASRVNRKMAKLAAAQVTTPADVTNAINANLSSLL